MDAAAWLVTFWILMAGLGWYVSEQKRRPGGEGFALGLLFGPFGVLVAALLPTVPEAKAPARKPRRPAYEPDDDGDDDEAAEAMALEYLGAMEPPKPAVEPEIPAWLADAAGDGSEGGPVKLPGRRPRA